MLERICIPVRRSLEMTEEVIGREFASGIETVDTVIRYVTESGGKRIRPALFLLAARISGVPGNDETELARYAAAFEMLHTASLMHDDVVDDAFARRGRSTARVRWGNQLTVLVGDFLWCRASQIFIDGGSFRMMRAVSEAVDATTRGELLEVASKNDVGMDEETYMEIIGGKTAAIFSAAARCGAIVADLRDPVEAALAKFGREVGRAFQLADDALDYVADESSFGKHRGTDLKGGNLTYPLIVALRRADRSERAAIKGVLVSNAADAADFSEITSIIDRYGGIDKTWKLARECANQAKEELGVFKPSIERDALMGIADYAVTRSV